MSAVDFASFLKVSGVSGATASAGSNSKPTVEFSEYLRNVNYKIDSAENKLISDYKARYVQSTPSKFEINNQKDNARYSTVSQSDRKTAQDRVKPFSNNYDSRQVSTGKSVLDNRVALQSNTNININNQANQVAQSNQASRSNISGDVKQIRSIRGSDILTPSSENQNNLVSKIFLNNEVSTAQPSAKLQGDLSDSDMSQDVAVEDNFMLASLVYKVFNIMNDTGAVEGTTMQGSNLKDFMEIIKQLPVEKMNELRTLIDPENLDITTEDKSNVLKIKDILLTTKHVIADSSEVTEEQGNSGKADNFSNVDKAEIDKLVSQMLAENGLSNSRQVKSTLVAGEDDVSVAIKNNENVSPELTSKVDLKSITAIVEQIRKEKADEELGKSKKLIDIDKEDKNNTDNKETTNLKSADSKSDDSSKTNNKFVNITEELLNNIMASLKGVATSIEDQQRFKIRDEIAKLMDEGMSNEEIVAQLKSRVETDEVLLSQMVDKLVKGIEIKDGVFVKVDAKEAMLKAEATIYSKSSATNELLKSLIEGNQQKSEMKTVEIESKVTTKEAPQIAQNLPSKSDGKQDTESKATLMKNYEELKLQIEKVVNAASGADSKNASSQSDSQKNLSLLNNAKPSAESQLRELTNSPTNTQSKVSDQTVDFNTQLKNSADLKTDKQQLADIKQAPYDVKDPKDIARLFKTLEQSVGKGESKITVSLTPENLGKMEIRLVETAGKITAKFFTENESSHKLIMAQADLFKSQLSEKGITIDNMEFAFNDPATKQGRDGERRTAKNNSKKDDEKENIIERDKNINFRMKASRAGGLYA